ncbi:MAG: ATP-binding protein [bacterium]|nr:ATP-binding protein [bacterium]
MIFKPKKGMFLPVLIKYTNRYSVLVFSIVIGAAVGLFILCPAHEIVSYYEFPYYTQNQSVWTYVFTKTINMVTGNAEPYQTMFFGILGALLGVGSMIVFEFHNRRSRLILQLSSELEKSFPNLISGGESAVLEFKSSFRWDLKENKMNRNLENVIIKSIAGFMNADGGTLIIGVDDDGKPLGVENDYSTLKKKDRDGFEQALMTAIASKLGTNICRLALVVFHKVKNNDVCRVVIMPAHQPVYVKEGNNAKFYLRTGVSTRELNIKEAIEYIAIRWSR